MANQQFSKFTPEARKALITAQEEAKKMNLMYIGTEHILLGILEQKGSLGGNMLHSLGITPETVYTLLEDSAPHKAKKDDVLKNGLSDLARLIVENSVQYASKYGHSHVGTEHLLLALVSQQKTAATIILESLGVNPQEIKAQLERIFMEEPVEGSVDETGDPLDALFGNLIGNFFQDMQHPAQQSMLKTMPQEQKRKKKGKDKDNTPALNYFTNDLTAKARSEKEKLDPVIGREKEINRVISILNRRTKNNPILIGEPGVGKTAIAEGIAQRIAEEEVPDTLLDKRVLSLDMAAVVAGTKYRGEFEERIKEIIREARSSGNVLLFIDEFHTVIGAGGSEGSLDAANILKPALSRGELQIIAASTTDEYRKHVENDAALERRLQAVTIEEPSTEDTVQILKGVRPLFEDHHALNISDEAIESAVQMSKRYIGDRYLPDKAIDLIDEAASQKGIRSFRTSDKVKKLQKQLNNLKEKKEQAVMEQNYEKAASVREKEVDIMKQLDQEMKKHTNKQSKKVMLDSEDIAKVIGATTGIPVTQLVKTEAERLKTLEKMLGKHIVGQEEAITAVSKAIRRSRTGIQDHRRPIGSFIFLGPTGVGKTELVKAIAKEVFNNEESLITIDMSEFMERHNVSRLVGATAGYVGYEDGGQLTESVRRKPYSVVLFDEIEKAHPEVFNMLLQILDEGRLTDARGRKVDFKNTVIIMTSNIGAQKLTQEAGPIGFQTGEEATKEEAHYDDIKEVILEELQHEFNPEFLNRVDKTIVFRPLTKDNLYGIIKLQLEELSERLHEQGLSIKVNKSAYDIIFREGYNPSFGARPIRRAIQELIEDKISEMLLDKSIIPGDTIVISKKKGILHFEVQKPKATKKPAATKSKTKKAKPKKELVSSKK